MRVEGACGSQQQIVCEAEVPFSLELVSMPEMSLSRGNKSLTGVVVHRSIDSVINIRGFHEDI